jgi:putative SOS response-associated peptidase YedK
MCGRYTLRMPVETLAKEFGITGPLPEVQARSNVAPTREVAAELSEDAQRHLEMLRWGLIPS